MLTNDVVSFEQPGPGHFIRLIEQDSKQELTYILVTDLHHAHSKILLKCITLQN